jgi:hypothetical protein
MTTTEIKIGYELVLTDVENYLLKAKFFDSNDNYLRETQKAVSCKEFNENIVYTPDEEELKNMVQEIVKKAMYKSMCSLLEKDIFNVVEDLKKKQLQ